MMKIMANRTLKNPTNRNAAQTVWRTRLNRYFKRFVFVVFITGLSISLEVVSLEIPNRYSVFPLYGFWVFSAAAAVFLTVYLLNPIEFFKHRIAVVKTAVSGRQEIPAVLVIIRRRKVEQPKTKKAVAGR